MTPLMPEARVNKNGVPVIKYVRPEQPSKSSRMISRILPLVSPGHRTAERERRAVVMDAIKAKLQAEQDEADREEDARIRSEVNPKMRRLLWEASARLNRNTYSDKTPIDRLSEKIAGYSLETLEWVAEVSGETISLTSLLKEAPPSEVNFRAFINFRNCLLNSPHANLIIENVRASTGVEDLAEIEFGSEAHDLVSAVIKVARESYNRRSANHYERVRDQHNSPYGMLSSARSEWYERQQTLKKMTRDLAAVVVDYPERVDDILDYMSDRDVLPEDVDGVHLRLHLENASLSMSSGVL